VTAGSLPPGLSMSASSGTSTAISGTRPRPERTTSPSKRLTGA
jgi:hypothetical protein